MADSSNLLKSFGVAAEQMRADGLSYAQINEVFKKEQGSTLEELKDIYGDGWSSLTSARLDFLRKNRMDERVGPIGQHKAMALARFAEREEKRAEEKRAKIIGERRAKIIAEDPSWKGRGKALIAAHTDPEITARPFGESDRLRKDVLRPGPEGAPVEVRHDAKRWAVVPPGTPLADVKTPHEEFKERTQPFVPDDVVSRLMTQPFRTAAAVAGGTAGAAVGSARMVGRPTAADPAERRALAGMEKELKNEVSKVAETSFQEMKRVYDSFDEEKKDHWKRNFDELMRTNLHETREALVKLAFDFLALNPSSETPDFLYQRMGAAFSRAYGTGEKIPPALVAGSAGLLKSLATDPAGTARRYPFDVAMLLLAAGPSLSKGAKALSKADAVSNSAAVKRIHRVLQASRPRTSKAADFVKKWTPAGKSIERGLNAALWLHDVPIGGIFIAPELAMALGTTSVPVLRAAWSAVSPAIRKAWAERAVNAEQTIYDKATGATPEETRQLRDIAYSGDDAEAAIKLRRDQLAAHAAEGDQPVFPDRSRLPDETDPADAPKQILDESPEPPDPNAIVTPPPHDIAYRDPLQPPVVSPKESVRPPSVDYTNKQLKQFLKDKNVPGRSKAKTKAARIELALKHDALPEGKVTGRQQKKTAPAKDTAPGEWTEAPPPKKAKTKKAASPSEKMKRVDPDKMKVDSPSSLKEAGEALRGLRAEYKSIASKKKKTKKDAARLEELETQGRALVKSRDEYVASLDPDEMKVDSPSSFKGSEEVLSELRAEYKTIASKKKKTDEDIARLGELESQGKALLKPRDEHVASLTLKDIEGKRKVISSLKKEMDALHRKEDNLANLGKTLSKRDSRRLVEIERKRSELVAERDAFWDLQKRRNIEKAQSRKKKTDATRAIQRAEREKKLEEAVSVDLDDRLNAWREVPPSAVKVELQKALKNPKMRARIERAHGKKFKIPKSAAGKRKMLASASVPAPSLKKVVLPVEKPKLDPKRLETSTRPDAPPKKQYLKEAQQRLDRLKRLRDEDLKSLMAEKTTGVDPTDKRAIATAKRSAAREIDRKYKDQISAATDDLKRVLSGDAPRDRTKLRARINELEVRHTKPELSKMLKDMGQSPGKLNKAAIARRIADLEADQVAFKQKPRRKPEPMPVDSDKSASQAYEFIDSLKEEAAKTRDVDFRTAADKAIKETRKNINRFKAISRAEKPVMKKIKDAGDLASAYERLKHLESQKKSPEAAKEMSALIDKIAEFEGGPPPDEFFDASYSGIPFLSRVLERAEGSFDAHSAHFPRETKVDARFAVRPKGKYQAWEISSSGEVAVRKEQLRPAGLVPAETKAGDAVYRLAESVADTVNAFVPAEWNKITPESVVAKYTDIISFGPSILASKRFREGFTGYIADRFGIDDAKLVDSLKSQELLISAANGALSERGVQAVVVILGGQPHSLSSLLLDYAGSISHTRVGRKALRDYKVGAIHAHYNSLARKLAQSAPWFSAFKAIESYFPDGSLTTTTGLSELRSRYRGESASFEWGDILLRAFVGPDKKQGLVAPPPYWPYLGRLMNELGSPNSRRSVANRLEVDVSEVNAFYDKIKAAGYKKGSEYFDPASSLSRAESFLGLPQGSLHGGASYGADVYVTPAFGRMMQAKISLEDTWKLRHLFAPTLHANVTAFTPSANVHNIVCNSMTSSFMRGQSPISTMSKIVVFSRKVKRAKTNKLSGLERDKMDALLSYGSYESDLLTSLDKAMALSDSKAPPELKFVSDSSVGEGFRKYRGFMREAWTAGDSWFKAEQASHDFDIMVDYFRSLKKDGDYVDVGHDYNKVNVKLSVNNGERRYSVDGSAPLPEGLELYKKIAPAAYDTADRLFVNFNRVGLVFDAMKKYPAIGLAMPFAIYMFQSSRLDRRGMMRSALGVSDSLMGGSNSSSVLFKQSKLAAGIAARRLAMLSVLHSTKDEYVNDLRQALTHYMGPNGASVLVDFHSNPALSWVMPMYGTVAYDAAALRLRIPFAAKALASKHFFQDALKFPVKYPDKEQERAQARARSLLGRFESGDVLTASDFGKLYAVGRAIGSATLEAIDSDMSRGQAFSVVKVLAGGDIGGFAQSVHAFAKETDKREALGATFRALVGYGWRSASLSGKTKRYIRLLEKGWKDATGGVGRLDTQGLIEESRRIRRAQRGKARMRKKP